MLFRSGSVGKSSFLVPEHFTFKQALGNSSEVYFYKRVPLVPGAGIYYTAYYFIQGNNALALSNGISTFKVAVALAVGISLVLSIPLPPRHRSG